MSPVKRHQTVSSLQSHLKDSIVDGIEHEVRTMALRTIRGYINRNVYQKYTPVSDGYERTYELLDSVTIGNIKVGYKYVTFEIFMDTSKISPYEQNTWNAHANMGYTQDTSDYIPLWIEEGTEGSLWDRKGANYMLHSYRELGEAGGVAQDLYRALKRRGWQVTLVR